MIESWDDRYRSGKYSAAEPHRLLVGLAADLPPGRALDLACGTGRHANFLAARGWLVTAVDNSAVGIDIARRRAAEKAVEVDYHIADLETGEFLIEPGFYDLICDFYYLQADLFAKMRSGVKSGGVIVSTIHLYDEGEPEARFVLREGELRGFFHDFEILHYHETSSVDRDAGDHHRRTAEIVCRKPA